MIRVRGLKKWFHRGGVNEVQALSGVDLDIADGEFVTVIGSNGAGKSTFLNCLSGAHPPDEGEIDLDGRDITRMPEYKRAEFLGRVFQDPLLGTCASLTIEQNLALAGKRGKFRGLAPGVRARDRKRFREALASLGLGLEDRLGDPAGLLSGGQRQALTMLMATLVRPKLLLLDEHTAALDPKTAARILDLTDRFVRDRSLTSLMVTHNMHQAVKYGHRLIMFHQGRIIMDIRGEEKLGLRVEDLLERFQAVKGDEELSDRMLLS